MNNSKSVSQSQGDQEAQIEKLEVLRLQIFDLNEKNTKTNQLIIEALESTTTDIKAANYVIHLYSELALNTGRVLQLLQQQIDILKA